MQLHETILCSSLSPTQNSGSGTISLHDILTNSTLASFKQSNANIHCTAVVESKNGLGGFVLSAQQDKSILNVYNFQKDQIALKIVLPEKLTCIAVDREGDFCAGGTVHGRIYLWEIASGTLLNAWDAHYRQVNVLRFTPDGSALISGSEDSGVNVWEISRLLDDELQNELPTPYAALSDHALPVTDIACGVGPFPSCRICTSSVDHTVKIWDLSTPLNPLTTFHFPAPIQHLILDPTERLFFAASSTKEGQIYQVNLFKKREGRTVEAVGGAGNTDIVGIDMEEGETRKRLITVGQQITTMTLTLNTTTLLVGTTSGQIHVYDVPSHQHLRTINKITASSASSAPSPITFIMTMMRPADLIGHVNLSIGSTGGASGDAWVVREVKPFERMRDQARRRAREVGMVLGRTEAPSPLNPTSYPSDALQSDHAFFLNPAGTGSTFATPATNTASQAQLSSLESEVQRLREQLAKAKGVNEAMWEAVVKKVVKDGKDDAVEAEAEAEDGEEARKRKRGRR